MLFNAYNSPKRVDPPPVLAAPAVSTSGAGSMLVPAELFDDSDTSAAKETAQTTSSEDFDLGAYEDRLHGAMLAQRRYPNQARNQELEGETTVLIKVDRTGRLVRPAKVTRSSGHHCLDREALRMVTAAAPFAALPQDFPRDIAEFKVPVRFELEDDEF